MDSAFSTNAFYTSLIPLNWCTENAIKKLRYLISKGMMNEVLDSVLCYLTAATEGGGSKDGKEGRN